MGSCLGLQFKASLDKSMGKRVNRLLHLFCIVLTTCTFVLIVAGGLVTSNDAGLSVPDWPLSYGQWMPEMVGGVFYEHGHRMIAAIVGILTLILNALLLFLKADRGLRQLGLVCMIVVLVQGLLGGVTVLLELPVMVSVLHASLAQVFFCLVVSLALFTSRIWPPKVLWAKPNQAHIKYPIARLLTLALFVQLILGALLRHSGTIDGVKAMKIDIWALLGHLLGALVVIILTVVVAFPVFKKNSKGLLLQICGALLGLVFVQTSLGVFALLVRLNAFNRIQPMPTDVAMTTSHLAVGAIMLAISLILTLLCRSSQIKKPGIYPSQV